MKFNDLRTNIINHGQISRIEDELATTFLSRAFHNCLRTLDVYEDCNYAPDDDIICGNPCETANDVVRKRTWDDFQISLRHLRKVLSETATKACHCDCGYCENVWWGLVGDPS
jgi:hypothetical protein